MRLFQFKKRSIHLIKADKIFLKKYMTELLKKQNQTIKEFAESEKWKIVLDGE